MAYIPPNSPRPMSLDTPTSTRRHQKSDLKTSRHPLHRAIIIIIFHFPPPFNLGHVSLPKKKPGSHSHLLHHFLLAPIWITSKPQQHFSGTGIYFLSLSLRLGFYLSSGWFSRRLVSNSLFIFNSDITRVNPPSLLIFWDRDIPLTLTSRTRLVESFVFISVERLGWLLRATLLFRIVVD